MKRIKVHKAYFITWLFILYVVYANAELLSNFFMATVIFSSAIVGFLAVGTLYQFVSGFDIMMLGGTFGALAYKRTGYEFYIRSINSILPANIAHMLQSRKDQQQMLFTEDESRDIIDWLEHKFSKQKSYINFFINTSMLIGLLGTFVGLVESIDKMGQIILSLNGEVPISEIMQQFSGPLSGMAIGFGASLFGVVTAVILGLNGYILFRYQDTLISGVEEWLKDRIIDIAPKDIESSISSAGSELTGHRKNFMDVYLDQLSMLTTEITKYSSGNENMSSMATSLSSIESILDEQKTYMKSMLQLQENTQSRYETLSSAVIDLYGLTNNRLEENKLALDNVSQVNYKILEQNDEQMSLLNKNVSEMGSSITRKIEQGNEFLLEISSFQKIEFDKNVELYSDILNNLVSIHKSIENEITVIEDFSTQQSKEITTLFEYQVKASETLESAIDSFKQGQEVLISLQKQGTDKNTQNSSALLVTMKEVSTTLEDNKRSIKSLLKLQEGSKSKELEFQSNSINLLETIDAGIHADKEISSRILEDAQVLKEERSNAIEEGFKSINTLIAQLSSMKQELNSSSEHLIKHTSILQNIENSVKNSETNNSFSSSIKGKRKGIFSSFLDKLTD
ncbi:MAG: MotA/TolQ/ExbB proton channel family protein [Sulfuricurvum sp.]